MKVRITHWCNLILSAVLWVMGFGLMGCTEPGDEYGSEPVMYGPAPVDSTQIMQKANNVVP